MTILSTSELYSTCTTRSQMESKLVFLFAASLRGETISQSIELQKIHRQQSFYKQKLVKFNLIYFLSTLVYQESML